MRSKYISKSGRWPVFLAIVLMALICANVAYAEKGSAGLERTGIVCIDPGHPSEVNAGNTVQNGQTEVDINWQVAKRLSTILRKKGIHVVLTKHSRDEMVTNRERAEIANSAGASIMIRLHCDTGGKKSGFTIYYPDKRSSKSGRKGPSYKIITESRHAAEYIYDGMASVLNGKLKENGIHGESATAIGKKQGALTGSIFSDVPIVTVEMVFLSNKSDAKFIGGKSGQKDMAEALAEGLEEYLGNGIKNSSKQRR